MRQTSNSSGKVWLAIITVVVVLMLAVCTWVGIVYFKEIVDDSKKYVEDNFVTNNENNNTENNNENNNTESGDPTLTVTARMLPNGDISYQI